MSPLFLILVILSFTFLFNFCCCSVTTMSDSLQPHGLQHDRLPCLSLSPCSNSLFSLKQKPHILLRLSSDCSFLPMQWNWKFSQSARCVQLFVTRWTIDHKTLLSMKFSRQEYWSELPLPSPGDFPDPGIELCSPVFQADSLLTEPPGSPCYAEEPLKCQHPPPKKKKSKENIISSVSRMWENLKTMTIKD